MDKQEMKKNNNKKQFKNEIKSVIRQIKKRYHPQKIVLFGSTTTNHITKHSDIDLLIIKNTKKRMIDRIGEVLSLCDYEIPIEPIVYTPKEIENRLKMGDFFLKNIFDKGIVLYDKR